MRVLPGQLAAEEVPIYAVMLHGGQGLPKVHAVVDHLERWIGCG